MRKDLLGNSNKIEVLTTQQNNIHFNLAVEEYLFEKKELKHPTLFLWRN